MAETFDMFFRVLLWIYYWFMVNYAWLLLCGYSGVQLRSSSMQNSWNFQTYYVGGTCFPLQEGWRCIFGCFFLEAKKPWWLYFHELDIFQPVAILIYLLVVELHKPKIHEAQKELPFLGNRFGETTESLEDHRIISLTNYSIYRVTVSTLW